MKTEFKPGFLFCCGSLSSVTRVGTRVDLSWLQIESQRKSRVWATGAPLWLDLFLHFPGQLVSWEEAKRRFCFHLTPSCWTLLFLRFGDGPQPLLPSCWSWVLLSQAQPSRGAATEPRQSLHARWNFRLFGPLLTDSPPSTLHSVKNGEKYEKGVCVCCLRVECLWF